VARPSSLLSAAELLEFRRRWFQDEVQQRTEFGGTPLVKGAASAGAVSITIDGLNAGTVLARTALVITHATGMPGRYHVTADVTVAGGEAALAIAPALLGNVSDNAQVQAEGFFRSTYNRATGRQWLTDQDVQEIAAVVEEKHGRWISEGIAPTERRYQAMRHEALTRALADSEYGAAIRKANDQATAQAIIDSLRDLLAADSRAINEQRGRAGYAFLQV
jgi:hypothetical protein